MYEKVKVRNEEKRKLKERLFALGAHHKPKQHKAKL